MLSSAFQKGSAGVEIFSPAGKDPFKIAACRADLNTAKFYDREIKGYTILLDSESHHPVFQTPKKDSETLGVIQPVLCLQARHIAGKSCSIELVVKDDQKQRRRLHFSTKFREQTCNALHAQLPWAILAEIAEDFWVTWIADLKTLCEKCFHSGFASLESIRLFGSCRLRKIFSMPASFLQGGEDLSQLLLPAAFDFPIGTQCTRMVLSSQERMDQGAPSKPHAQDRRSLPGSLATASISSQAPPALHVVGTKPSARPSLQATNARLKAVQGKASHLQPVAASIHPPSPIEASSRLASQGVPATAPSMEDYRNVRTSRQHGNISLTEVASVQDTLPTPDMPSIQSSRPATQEKAVQQTTIEAPRPTSSRPSTQGSRPSSAALRTSGTTYPAAVSASSSSRPSSALYRNEEIETQHIDFHETQDSDWEDRRRGRSPHSSPPPSPPPLPTEGGDLYPSHATDLETRGWTEYELEDERIVLDERFPEASDEEDDREDDREDEPLPESNLREDREGSDVDESRVDDMRVEGYVRYEEKLKEILLPRLPAHCSWTDLPLVQEASQLVTHLQHMEDVYITTFGARRFDERMGCFFV